LQRAALLSAASLMLSLASGPMPAPAATLGGTVNVYLHLYDKSCVISVPDSQRSVSVEDAFIGTIGALVASCSPGVGAFEVSSDDTRRGYAVDMGGSPVVVRLVPVFQIGEGRPLVNASRYPGSPTVRLVTFSF